MKKPSKKKLSRLLSVFLVIVMVLTSAVPVSAKTIALNKTKATITVGKSTQLKVIGTSQKLKWSSSSKSIATVSSNGTVKGKKVGTAVITVKFGKKSLKCKVTVKAGLNKTKTVLAKNDYMKLTLKGATVKRFKSSNPKIVKVSKSGKVTAVKKGKASITVTDKKNKKYTCKVTVEDPKLNNTSVYLVAGGNYTLKLNGNTQKISWTSSNKKVATVGSSGKVTAKAKGTAVITAKVGRKKFKCKVTVKAKGTTTPEEKKWTVSFETNGETEISDVTVKDGEKLTCPSNPSRNGYIFTEWYTDPDCTKVYDFDERVRKDLVLYGGWFKQFEDAGTYTRGEWIELLASMVDMNLNTDQHSIDYAYADTEGTEHAIAIETAHAYGLIPDNIEDKEQDVPCFYPNDAATREFVAYTVDHALGYETEGTVEAKDWSDWNEITYKGEVTRVVSLDIMRLTDGAFNPQEPLNENDECLIESGVDRILHSTKTDEPEDNSRYTDNVVKDKLASITDYTVTNNGDGTYRVALNSSVNNITISAGNTLVLPENDQYPSGIALKVQSVENTNRQRIFNCVKPGLADVYEVIDFSGPATALTDQIEAAEGVEVNYEPEGKIDSADDTGVSTYAHIDLGGSCALPGKLTFNLNKSNFSEFLELAGEIEVEIPDVTCILDADVGLLSGVDINEFTFSVSEKVKIQEALTYKLAESGYELTNGNGNTRFEAGRIELGRLPFAIGTTGLSLDFVIFLNVSAKGTVSISYTITAQEGFQYKNEQFRLIKNFSDSLDLLEIKGSASATIGVAADISALEMFDLAGVTIDFGPAFNASFTPHVLETETLYCSDVSVYATSTIALDQETVLGKFLKTIMHYTLEYELLQDNEDNPLRLNLHIENCHIVTECTFGRGTLTGSVVSLKDNSAIPNARVQIYDEFGTLVGTKYTDVNGKYTCDDLSEGEYKISISANNYKRYDINVSMEPNIVNYAETAKMVPRTTEKGMVKGRITDVLNGNTVNDTTYTVRKGWNVVSGDIVDSGSFASGEYELELETGNYTILIEKEGYIFNSVNVAVQSEEITLKNIPLSPDNSGLPGSDNENIRIVLTWGEYPSDLDSHLYGPAYSGSSSYFHTSYYDDCYYYDGVLTANLDLDDTSSYGPETTTIYSAVDEGVYKFYVHNFSDRWSSSSTALSESEAKVQIYVGNTLYYTFNVPTSIGGTLWHVFDYDAGTDTVIPVNTFAYSSDDDEFTSLLSWDNEIQKDSLVYDFYNLPDKVESHSGSDH